MFGHEKKLLEQGAQAQGVITQVSKRMQGGLNAQGVRGYDLFIQAHFDDGSTHPLWVPKLRPHDLQISESSWDAADEKVVVSDWDAIDDKVVVGAVVPVRYDPEDHTKLVIDYPAFKVALLAAIAPRRASAEAAQNDAIARGEAQIVGGTVTEPEPIAAADAQAAPASVDVADQLAKLADLRDRD